MTSLCAVVFAYSEVGHVCLGELLRRNVAVDALFTHRDDPKETRWFPSVAELATSAGIPLFTPDSLGDEEYDLVRGLRPDVLFSFYYRALIPERFLALPPLGAFNMHGSLLPRYRGRACVNWAVLNGERETGATLHHMVRRADAGDIVDQEPVPILFEDSALDVTRKVAAAARLLVERNIVAIADGTAPRTPQDERKATTFGRRTPADGLVSWSWDATRIYNLVRAVTHPFPGAFTSFRGHKLFLWRVLPWDGNGHAAPGTVLSDAPLTIAAGRGRIEVLHSEWEGESGHILAAGDVLGS